MTIDQQMATLNRLYMSEKFRNACLDRLHPDDFTIIPFKFVWECMILFVKKYKQAPSFEAFMQFVSTRMPHGPDPSKYIILPENAMIVSQAICNCLKPLADPDSDNFYLEQLKELVTTNRINRTMSQQQNAVNIVELDNVVHKIKQDWSSTQTYKRLDALDPRFLPSISNPGPRRITTGLPRFDKYISGGLAEGQFALLTACPGIGKTTALLNFCAAAAVSGARALFISLEMSAERIIHRYMAIIGNINANYFKQGFENWPEDIQKQWIKASSSALRERVEVVDMSMSRVNPDVVRAAVAAWRDDMAKVYKANAMPPLLVAVDWFDCLNRDSLEGVNNKSADHEKLSKLGYEVSSIARNEGVALWSATQGTKEADGRSVLQMKHTSGAYHKNDSIDIGVGLGVVRDANKPEDLLGGMDSGTDDNDEMPKCDRDLCISTTKNRDDPFKQIVFYQGKSLKFWPDKATAMRNETTFTDDEKYEEYQKKLRELVESERSRRVG